MTAKTAEPGDGGSEALPGDQPGNMDRLALTLDIGTTSTRAFLWAQCGARAPGPEGHSGYLLRTDPDGTAELDPAELIRAVTRCIDAALQRAGPEAKRVAVAGVSCYWHALLGLGTDGAPATPIYTWADTRSADAARALRSRLDERAIHARTGCILHSSYFPAKLRWLRESRPDVWSRVAQWVSPVDYLFRELFNPGAVTTSPSMASATGLMHQMTEQWDDELLEALELDAERLPEIPGGDRFFIGLADRYARRWPALDEIPFVPAFGDGACGNAGSDCTSPDRWALNLGTSGAIRAMWNEAEWNAAGRRPDAPTGLWRYLGDAVHSLMGAAFSDGGDVYAWLQGLLRKPPAGALEHHVASTAPGAHGMTFLPFLAGERSFGWNPDARSALIGATLATSALDVAQACMEGVALRFARAAELLQGVFGEPTAIIASGGALVNAPGWMQMIADAIGRPVTAAPENEASSRGAAILAMEHMRIPHSLKPVPPACALEPDADRHARYQEMLDEQERLYTRLFG